MKILSATFGIGGGQLPPLPSPGYAPATLPAKMSAFKGHMRQNA